MNPCFLLGSRAAILRAVCGGFHPSRVMMPQRKSQYAAVFEEITKPVCLKNERI